MPARSPEALDDGSLALPSDDARYEAVRRRDPRAEARFVYAVLTTGVYCRPTCHARLARRENVAFYRTAGDAERAGYRPCKRCRPRDLPLRERQARLVDAARRRLATSPRPPALRALAEEAGLSPFYFHRLFRDQVGMTPRQYAAAHRLQRVDERLRQGATVTSAVHEAGFSSSGRFYDGAGALGMRPGAVRRGGVGVTMRAVVRASSLGKVLVAATDRGVCAVSFGDGRAALLDALRDRFPGAVVAAPDEGLERLADRVVEWIEAPGAGAAVPLDLIGTAFQLKVWRVLRAIPAGQTLSYAEVARRVGAPRAVRAVGTACGANPVAVAVPCHRVVRGDGSLGGYRWGLDRKRALLDRERGREGVGEGDGDGGPQGRRRGQGT